MRKLFLAILAVMFISSSVFAQQTTTPTKTAAVPAVIKTVTGKVDSVTVGNTEKKIKSEIVVIDEKGQKITLSVKSGTAITSKDGQKIALSEIKKDTKVSVEYKSKTGGAHRAQAIKIIE